MRHGEARTDPKPRTPREATAAAPPSRSGPSQRSAPAPQKTPPHPSNPCSRVTRQGAAAAPCSRSSCTAAPCPRSAAWASGVTQDQGRWYLSRGLHEIGGGFQWGRSGVRVWCNQRFGRASLVAKLSHLPSPPPGWTGPNGSLLETLGDSPAWRSILNPSHPHTQTQTNGCVNAMSMQATT